MKGSRPSLMNPPSPSSNDTPMSAKITPRIRQTMQEAANRGLSGPLLLFMAGHRPLAFVASQLLTLVAPTAALIGYPELQEWAELLSDPHSLDRLEHTLETWPDLAADRVPEEDKIADGQSWSDQHHPNTLGINQRKVRSP